MEVPAARPAHFAGTTSFPFFSFLAISPLISSFLDFFTFVTVLGFGGLVTFAIFPTVEITFLVLVGDLSDSSEILCLGLSLGMGDNDLVRFWMVLFKRDLPFSLIPTLIGSTAGLSPFFANKAVDFL